MPGGFPLSQNVCNGLNTGVSGQLGTAVATSASTNTKGSWTQLIAATASDCVLALITLTQINAVNIAVDIGIGASGSEVVVIPNIVCAVNNSNFGNGSWSVLVPLNIPAGTRVAARSASNAASQTSHVSMVLLDGSFDQAEGISGFDAIGFVSGSTVGTAVAPTSGSKGAWVQLISATAKDYAGFFICADWNGATGNSGSVDFDIGIGASGSEKVIVPDICIGTPSTSSYINMTYPIIPYLPIEIPVGMRIAARAAATVASYPFNLTLYGAYR